MSDVPEGYKVSEVGVIPEEWEVKMLGEKTTKIGSGITPTGGEKVYKSEGRPFLRSQNVGWGNLILEDIAFIDDEIHNTFKATEIEKNDVFLNITGASIGRSAIADESVESGNVNQHVCIIRTIEYELNPKFLNYFLLSKKGQKQIDSFQAGGNRQGLNFGQIKSFQIPLPPLPEQQAIASALSDVDALIAALQRLITKKRNIKQGAMQQLLTGEKRLPGFGGWWEEKRLGEIVVKFVNGGTPSTQFENYWNGNIPWITGADILNQEVSVIRRYITHDAVKNSSTNVIEKGHLLLVSRTGVGKLAIAPFDVAISQDFTGIYVKNEELLAEYLYRYFDFNQSTLQSQNQGTSIQGITRDTLSAIPIPLPPLPEQTAIAQILTDMDAEIEALKQKQAKYKAIKQGMMQELLTGKTRLV